jgi:tetratricopeptide (TPR) repeat protein
MILRLRTSTVVPRYKMTVAIQIALFLFSSMGAHSFVHHQSTTAYPNRHRRSTLTDSTSQRIIDQSTLPPPQTLTQHTPTTLPQTKEEYSENNKNNDDDDDDDDKEEAEPIYSASANASRKRDEQRRRVHKSSYTRKSIPVTEQKLKSVRRERQAKFDQHMSSTKGSPSLWGFEDLFPDPVWDEATVQRDLYAVKKQDSKTTKERSKPSRTTAADGSSESEDAGLPKMRSSFYGGNSMLRVWREPRMNSAYLPEGDDNNGKNDNSSDNSSAPNGDNGKQEVPAQAQPRVPIPPPPPIKDAASTAASQENVVSLFLAATGDTGSNATSKVDRDLTRMVEDRMYGYRRTQKGDFQYETSLIGDGAVSFREGVRLGNPLPVNAEKLSYLAKKELQHGRVDEARDYYEQAVSIDPRDGRGYLGLSRCAERRRDFALAREHLRAGIANSISVTKDTDSSMNRNPDRGANPFLLQALGCLEEKMGHLAEAEALYIAAAKSRPSHAAAWVALAQLRTQKLGQSANTGRVCFQTAEREMKRAGVRPSSHIYTAWASLEDQKSGDTRRARELFNMALEIDPKCSAAFLQLGVMERRCENWEEAQRCFDAVLKFDQRNSRVLQAYALMETKRPEGDSRKAIELFERALKANPRDAGVLQPYALYVAELGDHKSARELLRRGTQVNKRHAAVWQAWGVLETRHGNVRDARTVFQQGIWACAQLAGGQSGGYHCARLWQAWGVLEAREGDHAAARRCFSRALDADSRNVPAVTAWANMEEELDNLPDARMIFERVLRQFSAGSGEKTAIWRNYELMEQRLGNVEASQSVFRRSMREAITIKDESMADDNIVKDQGKQKVPEIDDVLKKSSEVEVVRWKKSYLGEEVWLNDNAIEGKVPFDMKKRNNNKKK